MSAEFEALRRLRDAIQASDLDVDALVAESYAEAEAEVRATLKRVLVHDLLDRARRTLEGERPNDARRHTPDHHLASDVEQRNDERSDEEPSGEEPSDESQVAEGRPTGPGSGPAVPSAPNTASYVFGITRRPTGSVDDEAMPPMPSGGPLRTVGHGELDAIVCDVDPQTFIDLGNEEADLDVLAAAATAHDALLARCTQLGPVVPLRLGTVVPDDDAVRALLQRHGDDLAAELDRFDGLAEWAVTVQLVRPPSPAGSGPSDMAEDRPSDGRQYMQRQRDEQRDRRARQDDRTRIVADVHQRLGELAVAATTVQRSGGESGTRAHHGVYLLADDHVDALDRQVRELRSAHPSAVIEVSGPWPPYHFTAVALDGS